MTRGASVRTQSGPFRWNESRIAVQGLMRLLPLVALPPLVLALSPWLPRWLFMWAMAVAIYAGCKWLTFEQARVRG